MDFAAQVSSSNAKKNNAWLNLFYVITKRKPIHTFDIFFLQSTTMARRADWDDVDDFEILNDESSPIKIQQTFEFVG